MKIGKWTFTLGLHRHWNFRVQLGGSPTVAYLRLGPIWWWWSETITRRKWVEKSGP